MDEYDVPVAKASNRGFYEEMLDVIRDLLGSVLKDNIFLKFAVVTGCLRIMKESIFTGVNNLTMDTISDKRYDEYFGFTRNEVKTLLKAAELEDKFDLVQQWYDGYRFGDMDIYCPWDVLNYVNKAIFQGLEEPENFWANTSDNAESFYHAFVTGLMLNAGYIVESNYENGLGRSDITIKDRRNRRALVIEAKIASSEEEMEKECQDALQQIEEKQYARKVERSGFRKVIRYGIAFYKKECLVRTTVEEG